MTTPNINIDLAPVLEGLPKSIAFLFKLFFGKVILNNQRLEALSQAQNIKDANLIEQGLAEFRDNKFILGNELLNNPTTVVGCIENNRQNVEINNALSCLKYTQDFLHSANDENFSETDFSETFFNKWFNHAKEVSDEELQGLWGKLLAEEIQSPNSINYMILNTFSLMSKKQMLNFTNLVKYNAYEHYIFYDSDADFSHRFDGLSYVEFLELQDLNIVKTPHISNMHESVTIPHNDEGYYFSKGGDGDYYLEINSNTEVFVNIFRLTSIGMKLLSIVESNLDMKENCKEFAKNILKFKSLENIDSIEIFKKDKEKIGNYIFIDKVTRA